MLGGSLAPRQPWLLPQTPRLGLFFPPAPHLRGTEGRRSSAQVGGTALPLNPSSRSSRFLHRPTLVVYELQVLEVLQWSRAGVGTSGCSSGTSEC